MANLKGFIKNAKGDIILPISRGELIFDSEGNIALHSEKFAAEAATRDETTKEIVSKGRYGLISPEDLLALEEAIAKIKKIEKEIGGTTDSGSLSSVLQELINRVGYKKGETYTDDSGKSVTASENSGVFKYVQDFLALSDALKFKGTLGKGGQVTSLPTENINNGDTYKVIEAGTYEGLKAKVGDLLIAAQQSDNTFKWELVPSGDELETFIKIGDLTLSGTVTLKGENGVTLSEENGTITITGADGTIGLLGGRVTALENTVNGYTDESDKKHPGLTEKTNIAFSAVNEAVDTYEKLVATEGAEGSKTLTNGDKLVKVSAVYEIVKLLLEHITQAALTYLQVETIDLGTALSDEQKAYLSGDITN